VFAAICLPNFELQAVLRHEPELRSYAVALIDGAAPNAAKMLVLQCTSRALAAGVCAGQTAPQARARCRELLLKPRSLSSEEAATEILLQAAYAFSPNLEHTASGVCTIDLRGLGFGHPVEKAESAEREAEMDQSFLTSPATKAGGGAQESFAFFEDGARSSREGKGEQTLLIDWAEKILAALHPLNLTAQIGIATTPNLALLAAHAAKPVLVIESAEQFFTTLPLEALEPMPQVRDILHRWGIHTAGAFLALGQDAIAERLGAEALELFESASTETIRPLNIIAPSDQFEEQMDFDAQIETIEPLLFVLRRFVEQLATRIALTYRVVAELQLKLSLESGAPHERTFKVPAPTANVETLFRMLHTHLENMRTDAPITSLRLSATPTRAEAQQFGLFESALRDPNHFHETLARLTALLGSERVGSPLAEATHRPDSFRMAPHFGESLPAPLRTLHSAARNSSGLCLRRFRPAIHADVELEQGQPVFFSTLVMSGAVKQARGPWCASGTWWDQRRWARQEWDVETKDGAVYRLFSANGDWLVEGVYD